MGIHLRVIAGMAIFQIFSQIVYGTFPHLGGINDNIGTDDTTGEIFQNRVILVRTDNYKITYIVHIYGNLADGLCLLQGSADNNIGFIMILF